MGWDDAARIENEFDNALRAFDWTRADELCRRLVDRLRSETDPFPQERAERLLRRLRRTRQFQQMASLAEALTEAGLSSPAIGLLYAQALIEWGYFTAAERLLEAVGSGQPSAAVAAEVAGLKGRISKQRYVNGRNPGEPRYRSYLGQATRDYLRAYQNDPANYWHGINVVALMCRARRDGVPLDAVPDPKELARSIVDRFAPRTENEWELATRLEAQLALGDEAAAEAAALDYAGSGADAFEIASTLRQLTEVWGLGDSAPPGSTILRILRAALLSREGGGFRIKPETVTAGLEKVFGAERFKTVNWYQKGLERCSSIARIETRAGAGHGTGWLLNADDVFDTKTGDVLLVTNAHVVSLERFPAALDPSQAIANFRMKNVHCEIDAVIWFSPVTKLDAMVVRLKPAPVATGLPLSTTPVAIRDPMPHLYVIGHPGGRDLEFSLQDNLLLGCSDRLLHYRTPTEGGSSGSPVFEDEDWRVVALHHAGKATMKRLDGEGTYEANEGISIHAIRDALRKEVGGSV